MRIDALNQVSQLYQTSKPKKVLKNKENDTMETEAITIGAMTIVNASRNESMEETA